jgi:hypothetical protein
MKAKHIGLILAVVVALTGGSYGQMRGGGQGMGGQNRGERVRDQLATLRLLRMTQALDLTEEQTTRLFPTLNRLEKEKAGLQRDMSLQIRELRALLKDPAAVKEDKIAPIVASLEAGRKKVRAIDEEMEIFVESHLTPLQKAKYVIFNIDFMRNLTDVLNRAGQRGAAPAAPVKK